MPGWQGPHCFLEPRGPWCRRQPPGRGDDWATTRRAWWVEVLWAGGGKYPACAPPDLADCSESPPTPAPP
eukprot:13861282-Alexandrium_andersonii.AAC.1